MNSRVAKLGIALVVASISASQVPLRAQCLEWSGGFETVGGPNGPVYSSIVWDDGPGGSGPALYVGGMFTTAGSVPAKNLARWNGSSWSEFGGGTSGSVRTFAIFDDGSGPSLYIGGQFATAGSITVRGIARWNGVTWSPLGSGVNAGGSIDALAVFDGGGGPALYAGGDFNSAGGGFAGNFARWDGTSWFSPPAVNSPIEAFLVHDDGSGPRLYAGGHFDIAGSVLALNIARFDGANWSTVGTGMDGAIAVESLVAFDDGSGNALYAGGSLQGAGGVVSRGIVRWTGIDWEDVGGGITSANGGVTTLSVFDDGGGAALYASGSFTAIGAASARNIARFDGTSWSALGTGLDYYGYTLTAFDDGGGSDLYVGGGFSVAGDVGTGPIARWSGSSWSALENRNGVSNRVRALLAHDEGSGPALYAAGEFTAAGSAAALRVARWDGTQWSALGAGVTGTIGLIAAECLASFDDGNGRALYVGGLFSSAGGVATSNVAKWRNGVWSALGPGLSSEVRALCVYDDGNGPALYAGGQFTFAGGLQVDHLARWDGSTWSAVGGGTNGSGVYALAVYDDGSGPALYLGGSFTTAGGGGANRIARWDGSSFTTLGTGLASNPFALQVFDDGGGPALYATGLFASAGGNPAAHIARWDGSSWSALGAGIDNSGYALTVFDDGVESKPALYVTGVFLHAGGVPAGRIARWNGTSWSALGLGITSGFLFESLASFQSCPTCPPMLYVGGNFSKVDGHFSENIARWSACAQTFTETCAGDGSLPTACPCGNNGASGHGCANSMSGSQGATLAASGATSPDSVQLTAAEMLPSALSIFLQGDAESTSGIVFGDGVRCAAGHLKRLVVKNASGGIASYPAPGDPPISARSAALGDPIAFGTTRTYQVYYRDPNLTFCPAPAGNTWNVTSGVRVLW